MLRVLSTFAVTLTLVGCATTTPVTVVPTDEFAEASRDHDVILRCTVTAQGGRGDHTFIENYLVPPPVRPRRGFKTDLTLGVDVVERGDLLPGDYIELAGAKSPDDRRFPTGANSTANLGGRGSLLLVAFNRSPSGARRDYVLARQSTAGPE